MRWSTQKIVFVSLAGVTLLTVTIYVIAKISEPKKPKKK